MAIPKILKRPVISKPPEKISKFNRRDDTPNERPYGQRKDSMDSGPNYWDKRAEVLRKDRRNPEDGKKTKQ